MGQSRGMRCCGAMGRSVWDARVMCAAAAWLSCVLPSFSSPALLGTLFGSFAGFLDAVGFAVDRDDFGVVHEAVQLLGNRSDPPAFSVVIAQDLHLDVRGNGHDDVLFDYSRDLGSAAESRGASAADSDGRSDGSAIVAGRLRPCRDVALILARWGACPWSTPALS